MNIDKVYIDDFQEFNFIKLEKKYHNFYAPSFKLLLEGKDSLSLGMEISEISITNPVKGADQFSFTVHNAFDMVKKDFNWIDDYLSLRKTVEISFGYNGEYYPMLFGTIESLKAEFGPDGIPRLHIGGLDISGDMMKGKISKSRNNVKDSDVVHELVKKYKIPECVIEETAEKHERIEQENISDFRFIYGLAEANNYEFFIFGKTLYFRSKSKKKNPVVTLEWGVSLLSFLPEANISGQISKVEGSYWDMKAKRTQKIEVSSTEEIGKGTGKNALEFVREAYGKDIVEHVSFTARTQQEAIQQAKNLLNKRSAKLLTGSGETIGIPELRAGRHIKLEGLGKLFSRTYYVEQTNHTAGPWGYRTTFMVGSNKV